MNVDYEVWWPLHIRSARGEELAAEEKNTLENAYAEQDARERADLRPSRERHLQYLRELRDEITVLQARLVLAQKQRRQVKARIRRLASTFDAETRDAIGLSSSF